mmetsp:Transcript_26520/g.66445  ORF Transcript_26520/g.66445 Transcript_26520/m.66445 type:complete len:617 (-) Transcript_26520:301-2151(-)
MAGETFGRAAGEQEDAMLVAAAASMEAGRQHLNDALPVVAMEAFTKGILILLQDDVPIVDFGLAEVHQPPRLRSVNAGAIPLAVALLTGRANAASRLHRPFRALADTYAALAFEVADEEQRADVALCLANAFLGVGGFGAMRTVLEPFVNDWPAHYDLEDNARRARTRIIENVPMADGQLQLGRDGAFLGPIAPRRLKGKGRGMVATEKMEPGTLLLIESAVVYDPEFIDGKKCSLQRKVLARVGGHGDGHDKRALLDSLECMYPLRRRTEEGEEENEDDGIFEQRDCSQLQALAEKAEISMTDAIHCDKVVQRNRHKLETPWNGIHLGAGLFPLSSLFNHSCSPNASWSPTNGGLVHRLTRGVNAGDEITVSYHVLSTFGAARRDHLRKSHGFVCRCERCAAQPGSNLHEQERASFGMVCSNGAEAEGHVMLPKDPYEDCPSYFCAAVGCDASLSHHEAERRILEVGVKFDTLVDLYHDKQQQFIVGCRMAKRIEEEARNVLASSNHNWTLWARVSGALGHGGEDVQFACHALKKIESLAESHRLTVGHIASACKHAIVLGLSSSDVVPPEAAQKLKEAYRMQVAFSGDENVSCFIRCYLRSPHHAAAFQELLPQ